jgi:hypothetical protein
VFIEHRGMMDNFAYRLDWDDRLRLYRSHDIKPVEDGGGGNGILLLTEESDGLIDCRQLRDALARVCP